MTDLNQLLADGIIEGVEGLLKTGKEAEVWLVANKGQIFAAKIYKERQDRSFRNNAEYKEGRMVRNSRSARAIAKNTKFGQAVAADAWKSAEADALYKLEAAGVRVPKPEIFYEGILVMELVVNSEGYAASRLIDAQVNAQEAMAIYLDLRQQMIRMLCCDLIHGDLSPYNVLLSWQGPTVIDFPQVVSAAQNSRAEFFFKRDLENIRRHCASISPEMSQHSNDAHEIWRAYVRRELTPDFVPQVRSFHPKPHHSSHSHQRPHNARAPHQNSNSPSHAKDSSARPQDSRNRNDSNARGFSKNRPNSGKPGAAKSVVVSYRGAVSTPVDPQKNVQAAPKKESNDRPPRREFANKPPRNDSGASGKFERRRPKRRF